MTIVAILRQFAHDNQVLLVAFMVAADLIFGVLAAFKTNTFSLKYLAALGKTDILEKVVPWFTLYAFGVVGGNLVGPLGFSGIATGFFVLITGSIAHSIIGSLAELGVPAAAPINAKLGAGKK